MKTLFTFLISIMSLSIMAQSTFLKQYSYWDRAEANAVFEESDGYVVGLCADIGESGYLILLKTNFDGDSVWTKKFLLNRQSAYINDYAVDDARNKILIVPQIGGTENVFKFDNDWNLVYNGSLGLEFPYNIKVLNDDNYLILSKSQDFYRAHKINSQTQEKIWSEDTLINEYNYSIGNILENETGGFIITTKNRGFEPTYIGSTIYGLNSAGQIISNYTFNQFVLGTTKFEDRNLLSLAYKDQNTTGYNAIITYQTDGTILDSTGITVQQTSYTQFIEDGNKKVMAGMLFEPGNNFFHTAIASFVNDENVWTKNHGDANSNTDKYYPSEIKKTSDGGYIIVGILTNNGSSLPYLLKTDSVGNIITLGISEKNYQYNWMIYPNPATDLVQISFDKKDQWEKVVIYNNLGTIVKEYTLPVHTDKFTLNAENFTSGVYFCGLINRSSKSPLNKMIIVR